MDISNRPIDIQVYNNSHFRVFWDYFGSIMTITSIKDSKTILKETLYYNLQIRAYWKYIDREVQAQRPENNLLIFVQSVHFIMKGSISVD